MVKPLVTTQKKKTKLFFSLQNDKLEPTLGKHLSSVTVQTAAFNKKSGKYQFMKHGRIIECGGLTRFLKRSFYPNYKDNRSKRQWKKTKVKGSSKRQGKVVHAQVARSIEKKVQKPHAMTSKILHFFKEKGHVLQAAEVPVELHGLNKLTQADLITRDQTGNLWLWELKTGMPTGFFRKQGELLRFKNIEATKLNCWQLQLAYTRKALELSGVKISQARILHIYEHKNDGLIVKEYNLENWCKIETFVKTH